MVGLWECCSALGPAAHRSPVTWKGSCGGCVSRGPRAQHCPGSLPQAELFMPSTPTVQKLCCHGKEQLGLASPHSGGFKSQPITRSTSIAARCWATGPLFWCSWHCSPWPSSTAPGIRALPPPSLHPQAGPCRDTGPPPPCLTPLRLASARQGQEEPLGPPDCTASLTTTALVLRSAARSGRSGPASCPPQRAQATARVLAVPLGQAVGRDVTTTPHATRGRSAAPAAAAPAACLPSQPNLGSAHGSMSSGELLLAPTTAPMTGTALGNTSAASLAVGWPAPLRTQRATVPQRSLECAPGCCGAPWGPAWSCVTPTVTALGTTSAAPPAVATSASHPPRCSQVSVPLKQRVIGQPSASSCVCRTRIVPLARSVACRAAAGSASPHCGAQPSHGQEGLHQELPFQRHPSPHCHCTCGVSRGAAAPHTYPCVGPSALAGWHQHLLRCFWVPGTPSHAIKGCILPALPHGQDSWQPCMRQNPASTMAPAAAQH